MARGTILFLIAVGLLAQSQRSLAEDTEWRQGENSKVLPQYCQDRLDKEGRWKKWEDYFGPVYIHMHHYCGGVYAEFKANSIADKEKRAHWVREAIVQMRYVSPYCDVNCVVYADLHRRWAWALTQQGKDTEAAKHIQLMTLARRGKAVGSGGSSGAK